MLRRNNYFQGRKAGVQKFRKVRRIG